MLIQSEHLNELATALAKAQGQMAAAVKSSVNPHFKSRYADLSACWDAARGPLAANGLAVTQWPYTNGRTVTIVTTLLHASGQWQRGELSMMARDESPQAIGSTITYGRRYGFCAAVGIAPDDDDDGNEASSDKDRNSRPAPRSPDIYIGSAEQKERLRGLCDTLGVTDGTKLWALHKVLFEHKVEMANLRAAVLEWLEGHHGT